MSSPGMRKHQLKMERVQHFLTAAFTRQEITAITVDQIAELSEILNLPTSKIESKKEFYRHWQSNCSVARNVFNYFDTDCLFGYTEGLLRTSQMWCQSVHGYLLQTLYRVPLSSSTWADVSKFREPMPKEFIRFWDGIWESVQSFRPAHNKVVHVNALNSDVQPHIVAAGIYLQSLRQGDSAAIRGLNRQANIVHLAGNFAQPPTCARDVIRMERQFLADQIAAHERRIRSRGLPFDSDESAAFAEEIEVIYMDCKAPARYPRPVGADDVAMQTFREEYIEKPIKLGGCLRRNS